MNARKTLEFSRIRARVEHHLAQLEIRLELGTARVDLEPQVELLMLLVEQARGMSGGTLETKIWGEKVQKLAERVEALPHLQLVRG